MEISKIVRLAVSTFEGMTELGGGTIDMLSRKAGYCIKKAGLLLGYRPRISLEEGMLRSKEWAR